MFGTIIFTKTLIDYEETYSLVVDVMSFKHLVLVEQIVNLYASYECCDSFDVIYVLENIMISDPNTL